MGKISIDLSSIKAAGIYTIEIDNSQREITNPTSLRLLAGFNNKGPFNRPVFLQYESERQKIFGDIDNKLELKGCFFNRMALTMLKNGPVLALNLLKVDESIDGPDQVNYAAMSLDANKPNPKVVDAGKKYGEYDYQANTIDEKLYGTKDGDIIPYVGKTPYSSLFDRSRFWIPSKNNLNAVAANGLITNDQTTFEHTNLLNFANVGTDEISILVYKPEGIKGYDITAKEWWGGDQNIPYGWIRPSDYISDYFIRVVAVKGNWTNYPVLSNDPIWQKYFDKNGIIKDKIGTFCSAEGITFIGSWSGVIIPDFVDKQGNYLYIESKVNAVTERTGLLMSINEDALQVISYDKNGVDVEVGEQTGTGQWVYDFDANAQAESELSEGLIEESGFLVDMVGHNLQNGVYNSEYYLNLSLPESDSQENNTSIIDKNITDTSWTFRVIEEPSLRNDFKLADCIYDEETEKLLANNNNLLVEVTLETFNFKFQAALIYSNGTDKGVSDYHDIPSNITLSEVSYTFTNETEENTSKTTIDNPLSNISISTEDIVNALKAGNNVIDFDIKDTDNNKGGTTIIIGLNKNVEIDASGKYPSAYFLKTKGSLNDSSVYSLVFNGRNTEDPGDDVSTTATIRVLTKVENSETEKFNKAYVVIDASTNKPIKGNGSVQGVKAWYVVDNFDGVNLSTKDTNDIKKLEAYALKNINVSYNIADKVSNKKISDIIGTGEVSHELKLREVPVIKDTNDTFVYEDIKLYYGTYGYPDATTSSIRLFAVTGGLKSNSYAIIEDLGTISGTTITNKLIKNTVPVKDNESSVVRNLSGYTFIFNGNEYFVDESFNKLYKKTASDVPEYFGVNFLSYNYLTENVGEAISDVYHAYYFNGFVNITDSLNEPIELKDSELYKDSQERPVTETNLNTFIVTNEIEASLISVGDYINNIAFYNNVGEAEKYNVIPGITRVITKLFVNVDARNEFYYKGKKYMLNISALKNSQLIETRNGKRGFYLFTTIEPVYISRTNFVTRQIPITSDTISHNLKFIPLKGLHISAKHRPGFDEYGKIDIEGGITKIYSMLEDDGIHRGLCNPNMVDYRYVVDSMSYGLNHELGGKVYLSRLAMDRGKTTAILNLPSKRQFELSSNPCFCETYEQNIYTKPPFDTKYIPMGGNSDLYNTKIFTLPTEDDGSKFAAAFWPHLVYNVNGRTINVPPAADVCNVFIHKFQGGDPYVIAANRNGIIRNSFVTGVEFQADTTDREYLEPFGVNTIIQERNNIIIYGNQTCYQDTKSDFNKLHVRENLNTLEIACEQVLKSYNFLYNTPAVRASIVTALTPILEAMKLSQAIEKYNIVCDESNNTPDIIAEDFGIVDIEVWMSHGMEKIVQRITLNRRDTLADNE